MAKSTTKSKVKTKKKNGRPSDYNAKYCELIINYFTKEPYETLPVLDKQGNVCDYKLIPNPPPNLYGFAALVGVCRDTVNEWTHSYPKFSDAVKKAKAIQANIVLVGAACGAYQQTWSIFMAKNVMGWTDKPDLDKKVDQIEESVEQVTKDIQSILKRNGNSKLIKGLVE